MHGSPELGTRGNALAYLRFTPDDYRTLCDICQPLQLGARPLPAFKRLLLEALDALRPELAGWVARLRPRQLTLLYHHFRTPSAPASSLGRNGWPDFTPEEWRAMAGACVLAPFAVRFVRPFKRFLVAMFEETRPELARKLIQLSGQQFERLYEHFHRQRRESA
jgi:hypothetical protein